jgi:hypothetical protein
MITQIYAYEGRGKVIKETVIIIIPPFTSFPEYCFVFDPVEQLSEISKSYKTGFDLFNNMLKECGDPFLNSNLWFRMEKQYSYNITKLEGNKNKCN